jgi:PTH2 family peptidyl-tRNA hydrolase
MADARPPPSPVSVLIGTVIIAGISGYMIGIASSLGFLPIPFQPRPPIKRGIENYDDEEESSGEEIDEGSILDHAPNWTNGYEADKKDGLRQREPKHVKSEPERDSPTPTGPSTLLPSSASWADSKEECKLVLVVRTDLGMTKGAPHLSFLILILLQNTTSNPIP